jgi:hypothetical protein
MMAEGGPEILERETELALGRAFLTGDDFTKAGLEGEGMTDLWTRLGAGSLEAEGLAIDEDFGMPEDDFKGVAEVEGWSIIVARIKDSTRNGRAGTGKKGWSVNIYTRGWFIAFRHFVWHRSPWMLISVSRWFGCRANVHPGHS